MMPSNTPRLALFPLCALIALVGCGGEEDNHANHANHDENHENHGSGEDEACEHMKNGPSVAVSAAEAADATLEDATAEHTRVDVTLADYMGMKGGVVRYEAAEGGDFVFYTNHDVALAILDADDMTVAFEETGVAVDACAEVAVAHTVELEAGASYKLVFGPTEETLVQLVVEHAGEH